MHILYIHQYFRTPEEGGCTRSYDLAKGLLRRGHKVIMITAHDGPGETKNIEGIEVHYLPVPYANRFGFFRRIWAFLRFVLLSRRLIKKLPLPDLAYVMTTPLTTGLIALYLKRKLNIPYYFEVGDLWPAAPVELGVIRNRLLVKMLCRFETKCYDEAEKVVALSPAIAQYIQQNSDKSDVPVIPNLADCDFFQPQPAGSRQFDNSRPFQIGYFGTFGVANHLEYLLELARRCMRLSLPVQFTLMGEGGELTRIQEKAKDLLNVDFHPYGNKAVVKKLLEEQDAVYVSFKSIEILNTGSPNKFFDGLAAGKLIIVNFGGWIADRIERHQCGFSYLPEEPEAAIRKIQLFMDNSLLLHQYQRNARKLAETTFSTELITQKFIELIEEHKT